MAIALDATSSGTYTGNGTWNISHTVAGSDRYLIVAIAGGTQNIVGVTYNGSAMTSLIEQVSGAAPLYRVRLFGLVAPSTGTANIAINTSGGAPNVFAAVASSWTGVDQSTPTGTAVSANLGAAGTTISVNATSASGEVVVDGVFVYNRTLTVDSGQTQLGTVNNVDDTVRCSSSYEAGAGTTTMSWTISSSTQTTAIAAVPLKPVAGGGGGFIAKPNMRQIQAINRASRW